MRMLYLNTVQALGAGRADDRGVTEADRTGRAREAAQGAGAVERRSGRSRDGGRGGVKTVSTRWAGMEDYELAERRAVGR